MNVGCSWSVLHNLYGLYIYVYILYTLWYYLDIKLTIISTFGIVGRTGPTLYTTVYSLQPNNYLLCSVSKKFIHTP